ncbi:MAG TPA: ABC transporter permease [Thermoanaerobaculia bacterium]|nr:ABC transporter permease [Thermoanaerobaculia bacterium]
MTTFLLRRLGASLLLLLLILSFLFFFLRLLPGDPTQVFEGRRLTAEQRRNLERLYGLDRPLPEQYLVWISSMARGNWGTSLSQQRPVSAAIRDVLPATVLLASAALGVELFAALLLGVLAARRRGSASDHAIRVVTLLLYSQPLFWLGLMAILLFSYVWPVLPASHMRSVDAEFMGPWDRSLDLLRHLVLPALVMGLGAMGSTIRFVRGGLIEVMGQDYIRTARAKGLSERRVVWVHGMRNALVPVIQVVAAALPLLLSGSLIVEVVFSWPGLGRLAYQAILTRDYPLILGTTALSAAVVILGNFLADVLQALVNPRVRDA